MRSFVLFLALAVPSTAAFAATNVPAHTRLSSSTHKAEWVRLSFYNQSLRGRDLTIGENTFSVPARCTLQLNVIVGSTVKVSSPWESRISGPDTLQVSATDANSTVTLR